MVACLTSQQGVRTTLTRMATDSSALRRSRLKRPRRWLALLATVLFFYGAVGYLGCADMFGDHSRWRGINRGPADFGLLAETVSFTSQDGSPLKAWWLLANGTHRGAVVVAHVMITRDKSCYRVQLFSFMAATMFLLLTCEATVKAAGPASRPVFWRQEIFSERFDTFVRVATMSRSQSWESLMPR